MRRFSSTRSRGSTRTALALLAASGACAEQDDLQTFADVPAWDGVVNLEIGEIAGDDPYLFSGIGSVLEGPDGRVIVADIQSHEVRVFDSEGEFLFSFGRHGEGPGELINPCCLAFGPDGLLWVRADVRYSAFRLGAASAEYEREIRLGHFGIGMLAPLTFDADGRLVDLGMVTGADGSPVFARLHRGPGEAVDTVWMADPDRQSAGQATVPATIGDFTGTFYLYQMYGPLWLHAHGPRGAWAEAISSEYAINLHEAGGEVQVIEWPSLLGPEVTPNERDRAQARIDYDLERFGIDEHPFGIPDRKPPLSSLYFDRAGRLWVEKEGAADAEIAEADVYDGIDLVARYRWPARVRASGLNWITDSTLYGETRDSLGVQRVARVRFQLRR